MKLFLGLVISLTVLGAVRADDTREAKPRFKGVELYSWKMGDDWVFVLLDGTNALKSKERIKAGNPIKGAEGIKKALGRLAVGEQVFWTSPVKEFEFPPEAVRKEIEKSAKEAKIVLSIIVKD